MRGIDCALFRDMESSSSNHIQVVIVVVGCRTWPGRGGPASLQMGTEVIEVLVVVVSVSGFIVGAEGEEHWLR